jgi:hypothetical protein
MCDTGTERDYNSSALVSGRERKGWFYWPIAVGRVQFGMADPACHDFHQGLSRSRLGDRNFSHHKGFCELLNDRCFS